MQKSVLSFVLSLLVFTFIYGCAAGKKAAAPAETTKEVQNFEIMREDFDPLSLDDDDIIVESSSAYSSPADDIHTVTVDASADSIGNGYRVQIYQNEDREEAKEVQRDAILRFADHEVYPLFDPPYYKIRIGDFLNWHDAEKLQSLAIQKGFKDAWIIPTKVNLNKAHAWFEEL
jgi:hypothetical protein